MGSASRETPEQAMIRKEKARQQKLLDEEKARIKNEEGLAAAAALRDSGLARQRGAAGGGRGNTLLTGPRGINMLNRGPLGSQLTTPSAGAGSVGGFSNTGSKTLLGL